MKSTEELRQYHAVQKNILGSIEALGLCMPGKTNCSTVCYGYYGSLCYGYYDSLCYGYYGSPVLELYGKLLEQMSSKQYYHALKTLEQLEHTFLPRVKG